MDVDCLALFMMMKMTADQTLDIMWRIGNALRDPSSRPSVVFLWGRRGGEGKGLLMDMVSQLLRDVFANLSG